MNFSNEKIAKYFNYTLVVAFLLFITLPFVGVLNGMETKLSEDVNSENRQLAELPDLSLDNFSFREYVNNMESYLNDNFGFRSTLVKWNQLVHIKWFNTAPITSVVINETGNVEDDIAFNTIVEETDINKEVIEPIVKGEEIQVDEVEEYIPTQKIVTIQGDVIVGKDGWYYYAKEQIIDDYRGIIPLSSSQLEDIRIKLEEKRKWLNDQGIEFVVMVSPNKSSIYPEYMPATINKVRDRTRFDQLVDYMSANSEVKIIDPRGRLRNEKEINYVYEITGTHWNEFGAFVAYQELTSYLQTIFPEIIPKQLSEYNVSTLTAGGSDLAIMLSIQSHVQDQLVQLEPKDGYLARDDEFLFDDPNPNPIMPLVAKKIDNPDLPKAVIFRDSFMKRLVPYLSEHFSRSSYVWTFEVLSHVIEIEKPDIVIYEFVERKIEEVLLDIL